MKKLLQILLILTLMWTLIKCGPRKEPGAPEQANPLAETTKPIRREEPTLIFDEKGNLSERHSNTYKKSDGSLLSAESYFYQYDDRGNVIKEVKESFDPDGTRKYKNVNYYTFNERNQKTELRFESYDANNLLKRTTLHKYRYNELGYKIEDVGFYADGTVQSRIITNPDEKGAQRSEEYINYNEDGSMKDHKKYFYNESGLERTEDLMKK